MRRYFVPAFFLVCLSVALATGNLSAWTILLSALPVLLVLGLIVLLLVYQGWKGRADHEAVRLVQAGDTEGAIRDVQQQIDDLGPSPERCNRLGVLLGTQHQYEAALRWLDQAIQLDGGRNPVYQANHAMMLAGLGRKEEAAQLLDNLAIQQPNDFRLACNCAIVNADAGRMDTARSQLARAEALRKSVWVLSRSDRQQLNALLRECRQKVRPSSATPPV